MFSRVFSEYFSQSFAYFQPSCRRGQAINRVGGHLNGSGLDPGMDLQELQGEGLVSEDAFFLRLVELIAGQSGVQADPLLAFLN